MQRPQFTAPHIAFSRFCNYNILDMEKEKTKKKNNIVFTALTVIFALIFVFSLFKFTSLLLQYRREKAVNQQLVELLRPDDDIAPSAGGESQTAEGEPQILERYKALYETNGEMIGWIEIPGTQANGPVVQSPPENREKYLRLDFFGKSSNSGTFFLDSNCDLENSDNLIIHGHRMNNGTMFGELNKYRDEAFWREHPTFSFDTLYKKQTWEVVAACNMKLPMINIDKSPEEQEYNYTVFVNAANEDEYKAYVNFVREHMIFETGIIPQYGEDRLITLSTCKKGDYSSRFIVVARLLK